MRLPSRPPARLPCTPPRPGHHPATARTAARPQPRRRPSPAPLPYTLTYACRAVGANSKTNAVFLNHSPGALEDLAQAVQKGFMAAAPAPGNMMR